MVESLETRVSGFGFRVPTSSRDRFASLDHSRFLKSDSVQPGLLFEVKC